MTCDACKRRRGMTDAEFWADVAQSLVGSPDIDADDEPPDTIGFPQCRTCGSIGACGWDSYGRPLIHAEWDDNL